MEDMKANDVAVHDEPDSWKGSVRRPRGSGPSEVRGKRFAHPEHIAVG